MQSLSLTPQRIRNRQRLEDTSDADSTRSFGSNASIASACDHASFALNGTTWSGRSHRYIVHCSSSAHLPDAEEYLTPTQRAARQTRQLQASLREARRLADEREREVLRLTQELVELRMVKASAPASPERSSSSSGPEAPSVRELVAASCAGPGLVDSGHFDDGSEHSKESLRLESREELHRLQREHNDKVETLLNQLAEANERYFSSQPKLHAAESRAEELDAELRRVRKELDELRSLLADQEERNRQMYLTMYSKGQEAARLERDDQVRVGRRSLLRSYRASCTSSLSAMLIAASFIDSVKKQS